MKFTNFQANNQLGNETNPSIMNGMITYTYDNAGRRTGMNLSNGTDSFAQANYTYDTRGRIATVGNNTDTLTYTYVPGTNMIGSAAWQNASINTVNTYDQYKRLTNIAVNGANVYGYTLNDKNQRTSATLPDGNKWNYTYDVMGQLTGAVKQDTANNPLSNMNYFYDLIGNRRSATENSATTTYASNLVNQYTVVNAVVPVYDLDGNMTNYNGWSYTYNGENRLIVAENTATEVRVEADYDYMGRRHFKKVYNNNTLVKHSVFVYDGFKQIAEFDALNNNSLKASYLWQPVGLDIVLLRNNEYLVVDGNKNIIQVRNVTGSVTDSYVYDPFGKVTHNGSSENPFRFSSEFFDNETGLVYYNDRYYMPDSGKWINRDPIEEKGGINLYCMTDNNTISNYDLLGNINIANLITKMLPTSISLISKQASFPIGALGPFGTIELTIGLSGNICGCCNTNNMRKELMFDGAISLGIDAGFGTIIGGKTNLRTGRFKSGPREGQQYYKNIDNGRFAPNPSKSNDLTPTILAGMTWGEDLKICDRDLDLAIKVRAYVTTQALGVSAIADFPLGECSISSGCNLTWDPRFSINRGASKGAGVRGAITAYGEASGIWALYSPFPNFK